MTMAAEMDTLEAKLPVSVIVVNYNAGPLLAECVHSAFSQASEILVVDNASTDLSLELCAQRFSNEAKLKIVRNSANLGFAAACNIGASAAAEPLHAVSQP